MQHAVLNRWEQPAFRKFMRIPALRIFAFLFFYSAFLATSSAQSDNRAANLAATIGEIGNQACASCHTSIYNSYSRTPMAHASGPATEDLRTASFTHAKSGIHYQIESNDGKVWLSFERPGDPSIHDRRQLLYFIGSGHRGRTYLFSVDGFFFESPINWYSDRKVWDMAPAYSQVREMPLNLPAYTNCLQCHTSGMQPPVKGTENQYPSPLFTQNGVGCERCHGPGAAHVQWAQQKTPTQPQTKDAAIVNPMKLAPARRDSICMQCHLEANVAIARAGHHASDYRPGDILDDYVRHYVLTEGESSGVGANSQFEALAQSACKKKSGDAMSCMSCHDPHSSPAPEDRAAYFRGKCLACHGAAFGVKHHRENPDCTSCHMPSSLSADIAHTEVTDHRIPRRPATQPQLLQDAGEAKPSPRLTPFPYSKDADDDVRDRALAWQSVAENGMAEAVREAARLLPLAEKKSPDDPAILSGLAYVELTQGSTDRARDLYKKALALDPNSIDAASNLGVIEARKGNLLAAIPLWQSAFERAPGKSGIGMNLARVFCAAGKFDEARTYTARVLRFNPDLAEAKKLQQHLTASPPGCGL